MLAPSTCSLEQFLSGLGWLGAGAPDGYGPTGLTEPQLEELLAAVQAAMAGCDAEVTVVRRRKVLGGVRSAVQCQCSVRLCSAALGTPRI